MGVKVGIIVFVKAGAYVGVNPGAIVSVGVGVAVWLGVHVGAVVNVVVGGSGDWLGTFNLNPYASFALLNTLSKASRDRMKSSDAVHPVPYTILPSFT